MSERMRRVNESVRQVLAEALPELKDPRIGLVTITGILGDRFGGLGFFIFEGRRHSFPTEIFLGGLASIVLAVAVDLLLVTLQGRLTPWDRAAVVARRRVRAVAP